MSQLKLKTTYSEQGHYGETVKRTLYCIVNNSDGSFRFCDELGRTITMYFEVFIPGDDLWDAVLRLKNPFKDGWCSDLVEGVEYAD